METHIFSELCLVIGIGTIVSLILKQLRQPLIIGYILTGIIAGPAFINIIDNSETIGVFSSIGIALLLFIIGLDLSVKVFSRVGKTAFITASAQIGSITILGYLINQLLGFGRLESLIMGVALALSSTIIVVKLLNDKKETGRLYAQITIGILLIQDIVATTAKIIMTLHSGNDSFLTIVWLMTRGIGLSVIVYYASRYLIPMLSKTLEGSKELLLLFGLGWGLGLAALFQAAGFSIEIGALVAGVSLASLPYSSEMASRLKPLRDFFIVIFFISLGQGMNPSLSSSVVSGALVLSALVLFIKPLSIMISMGILGYTKRASFKTALTMSQISEFSLVFVFAALSTNVLSQHASDTITLVAMITFAASTYLMKYDDNIYFLLEKQLKFFERKVTAFDQRHAMNHYSIALFGFRKGGAEFVKTFQDMKKRFVVVDYDPEVIDILANQQLHYLYGDVTDPELLEELHMENIKLVISTIGDGKTNSYLARWLNQNNPGAVFICSADSIEQAASLYSEGASYVIMPHYIGTEKITNFIKRYGLNKAEFKSYREKHITSLITKYDAETTPANS